MHHKKLLLAAAITAAMAMTSIQTVFGADENMEKCYGVAKAGKNDCATAAHACAGHGTMGKSGSERRLRSPGWRQPDADDDAQVDGFSGANK
jgi:uncharacterized membrane protein